MKPGYIAQIIYDGFKKEDHHSDYLSEKHEQLIGLDKFQSLLFLNSCDEGIQQYVADVIGVNLSDLKTTIKVLSYC